MKQKNMDYLAIQTIRALSIDAVQRANSGHPGMPMGAAPMAYVLWSRHLKHNPLNPEWFNRDRFILSAGHGSMLLYSLLHIFGYNLTIEDIKNFRQWGSKTPGHPEYGHTPGVEATTGPLGQGIGMAVGMAMAERRLAAIFNRPDYEVINHYTYALCGDGDLMEGVALEALSLAGRLKLGRLIILYDSNDITLDGELQLTVTENIQQKIESMGWHYLRVDNGNDIEVMDHAIRQAKLELDKPTLIEVKTVIGYGSPNKSGKKDAHGAPLGEEEVRRTKKFYDWPYEPFVVPEEVYQWSLEWQGQARHEEEQWNKLLKSYCEVYPQLGELLLSAIRGELPAGWDEDLPEFDVGEKLATRAASGQVINALAEKVPFLFGGSADLATSNITTVKDGGEFLPENNYNGRNIWFGVREHAMGAALNGMALHSGLKVFGGTFFVFSDYLRPAVRLSALMQIPTIYVFTHDSIAVGEDGPTHQPIEHLPSLRAIPGLTVLRPADAFETVEAWRLAMGMNRPVALVLTRQSLPALQETKQKARQYFDKGAYIISEARGEMEGIIIASGSEVGLAIEIQYKLAEHGKHVRVVSMPSWELFEEQPKGYREEVLPPQIKKRMALEMASPLGWERYVGREGLVIGIDHFGASAPGSVLIKQFGFDFESVLNKAIVYVSNK